MWASKKLNFDLESTGKVWKLQLNQLVEWQMNAYENAKLYKERTKNWHDDRITNRTFFEGQQKSLQLALGTRLDFSTTFHLQTDVIRLPLACHRLKPSIGRVVGLLCWDEVEERKLLGLELMQATNEVIQKTRGHVQTAQSKQKSYVDVRRKDLEFETTVKVFLKLAPMKGVLRFGRKEKLSLRFIGPFEVLERIGLVAYRLTLLPSLFSIHNVFHVLMLRKYVTDLSHVVDFEPLWLNGSLSYEERPVQILAREVKMLRNLEL
ncbi:uncharacterized protein LOC120067454 [Benincasa hispida]|uniref:uncharacterized protein LOC120067454 n=1 Tax=Benincasa hispida TaxID=102211 RepID=UPI001901FE4F|nr:uncharacterized protein LOC120067454 [Benincasa hispida]